MDRFAFLRRFLVLLLMIAIALWFAINQQDCHHRTVNGGCVVR